MKTFKNKVALITGGGSGIGQATALAFAKEGARVVVADISAPDARATVEMIKGAGGEAIFVKTDVSKAKDVRALVHKTVEAYGRLDCAHNNAGVNGALAPISDYPVKEWDKVIAVNLTGVWLCMKYEISRMIQQGSGSIVNTSSIGGVTGSANISAYIASKFGVVGLTKTAALECAAKGVRINAVCPGWVYTSMTVREAETAKMDPEEYRKMAAGMVPMKRMGEPEDIAEAVLWLCSEKASYVNGHMMVVDGAMTAGLSVSE
ncbi:MAG: Levodione reductase [Syntrophorhabdus sp. PtaU1.Bin058]|nr:MAG: Levodione reductase [Syntrophorhabdus sp. PtaU1.Bin058]